MIKLIASDLDGTLLQNDAQALTPRAIDLISKLCDAGIHFVSASGRQYDNQKRVFDPLKNRISFIAENGSICMHQGKVISRATINDDLAARILKEIKNRIIRNRSFQRRYLLYRKQCSGICQPHRQCNAQYNSDRG